MFMAVHQAAQPSVTSARTVPSRSCHSVTRTTPTGLARIAHAPKLRMIEGIPVHISLAAELLVTPLEHLQIVLERVLAIPLDRLPILDSRDSLRTPDLDRPGEDAEVIVHPIVEDAGDDLLRMVAEVVEHRDVGVAGDFGALSADLLVGPEDV